MDPAPDRKHLKTLIPAAKVQARVAELGKQITADCSVAAGEQPLHLVSVLKGSFVFAADLIRAIDLDVSIDFLGTQSYGASTESSGEIRATKHLDQDIADRDVLLVEDIVDTGITVEWICTHLQRQRPRSCRIVTLLDKPSRRVKPVELAYVGFEIPDKFVVGYGLDYAQRYRNLPDICEIPESTP